MKLIYLIITALMFTQLLWAQINEPLDLFGNHEFGWAIVQLPDQTYVMASNSVCEFPQGSLGCIELVNIDEQGQVIWQKTYTAFPNDFSVETANSLIVTQDGGLMLTGNIYHPDRNYDAMLFKLTSQGDSLWVRQYGSGGRDLGYALCQTRDGGYAFVGITSFGAGRGDIYFVKTNQYGLIEWQHFFGGEELDGAVSIAQDAEGNFILGGATDSFSRSVGLRDGWVIKTDSVGNILWTKTYGTIRGDGGCYVTLLNQGGYLMHQLRDTIYQSGHHFQARFLSRLDQQGNVLWETYINGKEKFQIASHQELPDGTILVVGVNDNHTYGNFNASTLGWLAKLSPTGEKLWERSYYAPYERPPFYLTDAVPTSTGGFMVTGRVDNLTDDPNAPTITGNGDLWVLQVDSMGCLTPGCQNFDTPCQSFADTLDILSPALPFQPEQPILLCPKAVFQYTSRHPQIMYGDTLLYWLHEQATAPVSSRLTPHVTGEFSVLGDTLNYGQAYYATAVTAPVNYSGRVILPHTCSSVAPSQPIVFLPPIDLHAQTICDTTTGEAMVQVQLTGGAPSYNADQYHYQLTASNGSVTALVLTDTLLIPAVADQDTLRFTVSDEVGCVQELSYVVACPTVTSVATIARPPQPLLSISPNPIQQQAMLRISTPSSSSSNLSHIIQVHDVTGKIVQQYTLAPQQQQVLLDRGDLPDGMYFCTLHQADNLLDQVKIVLMH